MTELESASPRSTDLPDAAASGAPPAEPVPTDPGDAVTPVIAAAVESLSATLEPLAAETRDAPEPAPIPDSPSQEEVHADPEDQTDTFCTEVDPSASPPRKPPPKPPEAAYEIPPTIKPHVTHPPEDLTYKVLAGEPVVGLDVDTSQRVISDLMRYIDIMVDNELIAETLYIESLIEILRTDPVYRQCLLERSVKGIDEKLQAVTDELNQRIELYFSFLTSVGNPGRRQ
jgi:hypothetical protein